MIRELIDTELEAVAGGKIDLTFINQKLEQTNTAHQNAFAFGDGSSALNVIGSQSNAGVNSVG
jgi:hypothetical protein